MKYADHLKLAMTSLADDPKTCVVGYNVRYSKAGGTLHSFPEERLFEMPLAENLMAGACIGLSLEGWLPICFFERADFTLCACDALVNHLDKMRELSRGIHNPAVIIRVAVGNKTVPLFTGITHTQNFAKAFREMVYFPVRELRLKTEIEPAYEEALRDAKRGISTMLFEMRDLYEK